MRILVTRPEREARDWVFALQQAGWQAEALPLIEIAPAQDAQAVQAAWERLSQWQALMFVSANAAAGFFAGCPPAAMRQAAQVLEQDGKEAWATGPGTVRALRGAGWPARRIVAPADDTPQFDSEALWSLVESKVRPGSTVLIVRGADEARTHTQLGADPGVGRDWFAQQVRFAGGGVEFLVSYQRRAPQFNDAQNECARTAADDGSVWLFSSSEAIRNLQRLLPGQDWRHARALATHARIAQAAREAGFGQVEISRPALTDVQIALAAFDQGRSL